MALMHILMHAFSKASLFMAVGAVIHGQGGDQDARGISGGSVLSRQVVYGVVMAVSVFSLGGLIGLAGAVSKDGLYNMMYVGQHSGGADGGLGVYGSDWAFRVALCALVGSGIYSAGLIMMAVVPLEVGSVGSRSGLMARHVKGKIESGDDRIM